MYCLTRKTLKCNILVQKFCIFLQKETSHCKNSFVLVPQGHKQYILGNYFYSNSARKLRFHIFLLLHVRKHMTSLFYLKWTEFTRNCEFCSNCGSPGTRTKYHTFLRIKMEEYIKPELSGFFWVKIVAKNAVPGDLSYAYEG